MLPRSSPVSLLTVEFPQEHREHLHTDRLSETLINTIYLSITWKHMHTKKRRRKKRRKTQFERAAMSKKHCLSACLSASLSCRFTNPICIALSLSSIFLLDATHPFSIACAEQISNAAQINLIQISFHME